ncbi:MAG: hypothetical protein WC556_12740 [Candidatus Methanoperedens sp.]
MEKFRPLSDLLNDTTAAAHVPGVAKEGIISLLISIVANEATSTVSGLTYENILRMLIMFLVVLAIIHYSLKIIEQLRRKSANLGDIQGVNTRKALNDLNHSRTILDRLIQDSTEVTELRNLRNKLTTLISDIQNPNLSKFGQRSATVDEFNSAEKALVESSEKLAKELERQSKESVDVKVIAQLVDSAGESIRSRIPLSNELKDLYVESRKKDEQERKKIPEGTSPELNLYLNALQTKYANNRPEVLHTGDYLPDAKWEYEAGDRNVTAKLSNGFSATPLLFEVLWQDSNGSIVEVVQEDAEDVKKNQFKCLCLVNTAWGKESKDFASRFTHPKLALYLYEMNGGLVFNMESPAAKHYEFWFNTEQKFETVREKAQRFIEGQEYFTAQDVAGVMGMKIEGAEMLLVGLEKNGIITDVSFKSDKVKKYTKAKLREDK